MRWRALDYDNFEVIVLDNNTPDPETVAARSKRIARRSARAFASSISTT